MIDTLELFHSIGEVVTKGRDYAPIIVNNGGHLKIYQLIRLRTVYKSDCGQCFIRKFFIK